MNDNEWERVADVGVDTGTIWVGDPCYTMTEEAAFPIALTWGEWCAKLNRTMKDHVARFKMTPFADVGVAVTSGAGDGIYPVYVRRNAEGRIAELRVDFSEHL